MVRFSASQSVTISVPSQPLSIEAYLSEADRLVYALVDASQVEVLSSALFRVKVRPIRFIGLSLQPICDIEVWSEGGTVRLCSNRCQIEGYESFNERFSLNLQGYLVPQFTQSGQKLRGQANLSVSVDLPQAMRLTPKPLLERTGNSILNGILITLKQRLMRQLINDYCAWASSSPPASKVSSLP
ncbi:MAG: DUF1997 domain-containing protein [Phormidesmis sp. RL_2_1]|nr:DUF1997 domain-containing protein [Phormidesmis sp. RL_2_1]